ncbi:MAG: hypothetical protein HYT75_00920 [Deltaproteobacteria bacterium]|nr:hypothetical protein [Deltaproteobacteria bacterium]
MNQKNNNTDYLKKLETATGDLKQMSDKLFDMALHLALTGKWNNWEESMPIGTTTTFNEEMLFKTGDEFISNLTRLRMDLLSEVDRIKSYLGNQKKSLPITKPLLTGHKTIDKATGGLKCGDVIALAGASNKETALKVITKVALQDKVNCGIFSLEKNKEKLVKQMLSIGSKVGLNKITGGRIASNDWPKLDNAADKLSTSPIYIKDNISSEREMSDSTSKAKIKLGLIMVKAHNKSIPVKSLKNIATNLQIPIIVTTKKPVHDFDTVINV